MPGRKTIYTAIIRLDEFNSDGGAKFGKCGTPVYGMLSGAVYTFICIFLTLGLANVLSMVSVYRLRNGLFILLGLYAFYR